MLETKVTDALGHTAESYTDAKGRNRETVQHAGGENITVSYAYDPVNQVTTVTHPNGHTTTYEYDELGRKLKVNHPDAGKTDMTYGPAGNLLTKLTANLKKSISEKGTITYTYDFERLKEILYPKNVFNRVTYTYGQAGDKYSRAGSVALIEDGSGGEAYYYGRQGEVIKTVCTVVASTADIRTWVYGATYDSWNRVRTMTYPDGEVVTYHYNAAGQIESLTGNKLGKQSVIVERIGYDKGGHTVYQKLGNGTETTYAFDKQRERLQNAKLTIEGQTVMDNKYRYDAVDNILGITNATDPTSLTKLNRAKLGGRSSHTYEYDELNRLIHANGKAKRASYDMVMSFGRMSEPLTKVQKVDSTTTAKSYNFAYKYEDSNHPTAPTQIGHDHYTYDANGNPTLVTNDSANTTREMYWDEDNRLMVLSDNGKTSRYTYNAAGERIMKSYGTMEGVYINGAPQGITFHETDNFTLYPASIISINKNRFTKHYFIGDKRIASRIGTGLFNNVYGRNGSYVTAGQQDYAERMNQIQKQKEAYYKQQGIAPGVPTEKGAYGDPENTGLGYNAVLTELGNHDVPQGWIQTPRPNTTPGTNPGPPVSWNDPSNPDDPQAGYGYIPNDTTKEETFFYHSDHLGSTSYITDDHANITQYDAYLPYGELLVDEHSSSEDLPYKFNGKQFDEETGLYYYGARYMNPVTSLWYGVDVLTEKYDNVSSYIYCKNNPIAFMDMNGKDGVAVIDYENHSITINQKFYYNVNDDFLRRKAISKGAGGWKSDFEINSDSGWGRTEGFKVSYNQSEWNVNFNQEFIGCNSMDEINQHLEQDKNANAIVGNNEFHGRSGDAAGEYNPANRFITLGEGAFKPNNKGQTLQHEIGHSWGLEHDHEMGISMPENDLLGQNLMEGGIMTSAVKRSITPQEVSYGIGLILQAVPNNHSSKVTVNIHVDRNYEIQK